MTFDQVRQDVQTEVERAVAAWAAYPLPVEIENRSTVALGSLLTPYVMVDILWGDGRQLDLGKNPLVADYGTIVLAAGVKEGDGTSDLLKLLQHFRPYLQLRDNLGVVRTGAAYIGAKPAQHAGFYYLAMQVPFWAVAQAPAVP